MHTKSDTALPDSADKIMINEPYLINHSPLIQPLRVTRSSQSMHNPFSKPSKGLSSNLVSYLPHNFHEFFNYKPTKKESIDSIEQPTENEKEMSLLKPIAALKRASSHNTENEMNFEIKLHSILTYEMERELGAILKLEPILSSEIKSKKVKIPLTHFKNTIILDIDETLTHTLMETSYSKKYNNLDIINLSYYSDLLHKSISFQIVKRPFLELALKMLHERYELIAFTASEKCYADAILNEIDPNRYISSRLYRDSCIYRGEYKIKDLRILNRNLKHVAIVDNSLISFASQLNNGIPIKSFCGEWDDVELLEVNDLLKEHKNCEDFQMLFRDTFCLEKIKAQFN